MMNSPRILIFSRYLPADSIGHSHVGAAQDQDNLMAVRRFFEQALSIYESSFGSNHPGIVITLVDWAFVLPGQAEINGSKPCTSASLCPNHPHVAPKLEHRVRLLHQQGEYIEAKALLHHPRGHKGQDASQHGHRQSQQFCIIDRFKAHSVCGIRDVKLQFCSKCKLKYYCSAEC